jgi:hypothetical protein
MFTCVYVIYGVYSAVIKTKTKIIMFKKILSVVIFLLLTTIFYLPSQIYTNAQSAPTVIAVDDTKTLVEEDLVDPTSYPIVIYALDNDTIDLAGLSSIVVTQTSNPSYGTVTFVTSVINNPTFSYIVTDQHGVTDYFDYQVCGEYNTAVIANSQKLNAQADGQVCDTGRINIVYPSSNPPNATDDTGSIAVGQTNTTINVIQNDIDTLKPTTIVGNHSVRISTQPTKGSVTLNTDQTFTYTPNSGSTGSDSFQYELCRIYNITVQLTNLHQCDIANVNINISAPISRPPVVQTAEIKKQNRSGFTDPFSCQDQSFYGQISGDKSTFQALKLQVFNTSNIVVKEFNYNQTQLNSLLDASGNFVIPINTVTPSAANYIKPGNYTNKYLLTQNGSEVTASFNIVITTKTACTSKPKTSTVRTGGVKVNPIFFLFITLKAIVLIEVLAKYKKLD